MSKPSYTPGLLRIRSPQDFAAAFDVGQETIGRLIAYEALLQQWQRALNLVAPSTLDEVWHRHFADSAQLLALAPQARTWLDLGSGAGFPGLVAAILLADAACGAASAPQPGEEASGGRAARPHITLIESNTRKCAFLREVVRQTGLLGRLSVDILSTRIEKAATQANLQGADVVTARALAPLDKLLDLAGPLLMAPTVGLFLKGRSAAAEIEAARSMWSFTAELVASRTEAGAQIVVIRHLQAKGEPKGPIP
jgi:16S rRNA (guanine527-N7)-methyltransferase